MAAPAALLYTTLGAFFGKFIETIVFRGLAALGIGIAVYSGMDTLVDTMKTYIQARFTDVNALIPQVFDLLVYIQIDVALQMVFSAFVAVTAIAPIRWVYKK
jgi:hypothetical protein